jgi:TraG P-loop domain
MGPLGKRAAREQMNEAGDLLPVEAIDRTGLAVTSDGAFVRILNVTPPNPLILSEQERAKIAHGYCRLVSQLTAGQNLQFYVESRPLPLAEILDDARREVECTAGPPPASLEGEESLSLSRWRLYASMAESLRLHCDEQAAVRTSYYIVCPYVPVKRGARDVIRELLPGGGRLRTAPLKRPLKAHRRAARESLAFTEALRSELDRLAIPSRVLNGEEVVSLLWGRFNPTQADRAVKAPPDATEILGDLDRPVDAREAREVARRLRGLIAQSPVDFTRSHHHVEIDRDVEQTMWVATTADHTYLAWMMGATMTREPFSLSVHVRALDRRRERAKLKMRYRRVFSVNRGAEARGRVPDFDRLEQEEESARLLREMGGHERTGLFDVSIYHTPRACGPEPDLAALGEAVDFCAEALSNCEVAVNRGAHHQRRLWPSTLPLGRDTAKYSRVYATRNVGDCVPLLGTSCGSPTGVPFAFAQPGRTLERLNPTDRVHDNQTVLLSGKSGSGKSHMVNIMLGRFIALGIGPVFIIDRAGHYQTLTRLVYGARHLDIGSDESEWAINQWDTPDQSAPPREKVAFLTDMHAALMGSEGLTVLERSQLATAIRQVYANAHAEGVAARESMLHAVLLDRARQESAAGAVEIGSALRNLAERLGEFCGAGAYSYLLDRPTNIPTDSPLVVFNTESCPEAILGGVMLSIVEYVIRQVRRHNDECGHLAGQPGVSRLMLLSCLVIDEAWHKVAGPEAGVYLADLARRARHLGLLLFIITQALSDLNTPWGLPLLVNYAIAVFFKQVNADELDFDREGFGLTEEQAAIVGNLETVKGRFADLFWRNGPRGSGRARFPVGPREYWAATNEKFVDIPARNAMIARCNDDVFAAVCALAQQGVPVGDGE